MICKGFSLELIADSGKHKIPKATYDLSDNQRKMVCGWIKELKFPNVKDGKIYGMKSHDRHVFISSVVCHVAKTYMKGTKIT